MKRRNSMPWQPFDRLKIGAAFFTAASNSASKPGLTSICAISVIILVFTPCPQCAPPYHERRRGEVRKRDGLPCQAGCCCGEDAQCGRARRTIKGSEHE